MPTDDFRLTIHMVSSLDGFVAKPDNSVAWFETPDQYEKGVPGEDPETFLGSIDCYVMGSRTYEHALALATDYGWAYGDTPTVVLTSRNLPVHLPNVELFQGDPADLIRDKLKPRYRNVWVVGGPELTRNLIRQGQADEIRVSILPILLGEGRLFFEQIGLEKPLHLQDVTAYRNGMVELTYEIRT